MRVVIGLAAVAAMLVTAGCAASRPTALEKAADSCLQAGTEWAEVQNEGKALHLQVKGLGLEGLDREEADCVLKAAGATDATFTKMDNTKANGSEQTSSWDGHEAKWTLDPVDGTSITVTAK